MRGGIRIGRVFGIELILDPTWILIVAFLTWSLAAMFGRAHPEWTPAMSLLLGVIATFLFFLSILLHELAHALVAILSGLQVRSITLFLFGGVSTIEAEPRSPGNELLMAIAGPIESIGLGFWLAVVAAWTSGLHGPIDDPMAAIAPLSPLATLLAWLGAINMLVGVFNLVPAFPLDGGRVLRAILWAFLGDFRRATSWATATGKAFAWLFIVAGIAIAFGAQLPFFGTGLASGLWLVLIGWFLSSAATSTQERLVLEEALEGLQVARVMRRSGASVAPEVPVAQLVSDRFMASDQRAYPVMHDEDLVGIVSLADVRVAARDKWSELTVRDIMTPREGLATVTPEEAAFHALELMTSRDVSQLPVLQNGKLVGMVERRDLMRWLETMTPRGAPPRPSLAAR
jgi:Zn-dependent protease/CBS domain-containing protein